MNACVFTLFEPDEESDSNPCRQGDAHVGLATECPWAHGWGTRAFGYSGRFCGCWTEEMFRVLDILTVKHAARVLEQGKRT